MPDKNNKVDQFINGIGAFSETLRLFYTNCINQKFTTEQSLQLTIAFMQSEIAASFNQNRDDPE